MSVALLNTQQEVSRCMERIQSCFKPGSRITVVVRNPTVPGDTDFIMTDDDLAETIAAIQRQQKRAASKPASPT